MRSRKFAGVRGVLSVTRRFVEAWQAEDDCLVSRCESANLSDETEQEFPPIDA